MDAEVAKIIKHDNVRLEMGVIRAHLRLKRSHHLQRYLAHMPLLVRWALSHGYEVHQIWLNVLED